MKNFSRCTVVTRFQNYAKMSFGLKFFLLFTPSCKFLDGALKRTIAAIKNNFLEREKTFFFDPLRSFFFSSEAASFESNFYWTITQLETDIGGSSSTDWSDTKTAGSRADKWAERAGRGRRQPGREMDG